MLLVILHLNKNYNQQNLLLILVKKKERKKEMQEIKFFQRQIEILFFNQFIAIDMIQCQYVPCQQICNNVRVCDVVIFNKKIYSWSLSPFWARNSRNSRNFLYVFCYVNTVTLANLLMMEASCSGKQPYD